MSVNFIMGKDAKCYYGPADTALASLTELTNVRDLTLTLDAGDPFRLQAAVLARPDLGNSAKLLFAKLLCDAAFRQGWLLTKPAMRFVAEAALGEPDPIDALSDAGAVTATRGAGMLSVGLGPWAARLLWEG